MSLRKCVNNYWENLRFVLESSRFLRETPLAFEFEKKITEVYLLFFKKKKQFLKVKRKKILKSTPQKSN